MFISKENKETFHIFLCRATNKLFTNVAKVNARGNAQANIIIIPNCNANSRKSANSLNCIHDQ